MKIFDKTQQRSEYVGSGFDPGLLYCLAFPRAVTARKLRGAGVSLRCLSPTRPTGARVLTPRGFT